MSSTRGPIPALAPGHMRGSRAVAMLMISTERLYIIIKAGRVPGAVLVEPDGIRTRTFCSVPETWVQAQLANRDRALLDGPISDILKQPAALDAANVGNLGLRPETLAALDVTSKAMKALIEQLQRTSGHVVHHHNRITALLDELAAERETRQGLERELQQIRLLLMDRATSPPASAS